MWAAFGADPQTAASDLTQLGNWGSTECMAYYLW
jgi:hypothetical protein